jgi:hypothetical protein
MSERREESRKPVHDRALLLHGPKRNEVLTLREVQQYGIDSSSPAFIFSGIFVMRIQNIRSGQGGSGSGLAL